MLHSSGEPSPRRPECYCQSCLLRGTIVAKLLHMHMRSALIPLLVLLTASITVAQQATFRTGTQIVSVVTTVTDSEGRLVPGLEREAFTILDNGDPQEITFFQNEVQPFTVVVMMDFSGSMTANLGRLKAAAEQFIIRMLPEDKGQVGSFSDKIQFSGTFTSDRDDLIFALRDLQFGIRPGSGTRSTRALSCCRVWRGARLSWGSPMATTRPAAPGWATFSIAHATKRR